MLLLIIFHHLFIQDTNGCRIQYFFLYYIHILKNKYIFYAYMQRRKREKNKNLFRACGLSDYILDIWLHYNNNNNCDLEYYHVMFCFLSIFFHLKCCWCCQLVYWDLVRDWNLLEERICWSVEAFMRGCVIYDVK